MNRWWGAGLFAGGLLAGWLVRGGGDAASVEEPAAKVERQRRDSSRKTVAHDARWQGLDQRLLTQNHEEREVFSKNLTAGDRLSALESLMRSAGPEGINYELRTVMDNILRDWAKEDFDGAWAGALGVDNPGLRRFMLSTLLENRINEDPDKALSLYLDQVAVDPAFSSNVPLRIVGLRAGQGADAFIDTLSKLPWSDNTMGTEMKFATGFDFRKVADAVAALANGHPGKNPQAFPTNFFEKWSSLDPEEAQTWWRQNGTLSYNSWGGLLSGVEKKLGATESAAWAARELEANPEKRETMLQGMDASREGFSTRLNLIADAMPDTAARDRLLSDAFASLRYSDPLERFGFAITGMSSPEARLEALRNFRAKAGYIIDTNVPDTQLQQWGITRQQMTEALRGEK